MRTYVLPDSKQWSDVKAEFVEAQAGQCPICGHDLEAPHLDHCHATGMIRGALCSSCNTKLGWYEGHRKEIETYLASAAEYAAYAIAPRMTRNERLRHHWQQKDLD